MTSRGAAAHAAVRPTLQRANASTASLPVMIDDEMALGKRRPSFSASKWASLNPASASASNSPIATPQPLPNMAKNHYFDNVAASSGEMSRTDSNDSSRSLRGKSSRKELRELARSGTPSSLTSHTYTSTKQMSKKERQAAALEAAQQQDDDDDARSIESFTCTFSCEFDRQKRSHAVSKGGDGVAHQRWLDSTFRKLSQKSGARRNAPHIKTPSSSSIKIPAGKGNLPAPSQHFLDFSAIISPIPCSEGDQLSVHGIPSGDNITPRPADFPRFPREMPPPQPAQRSMDDAEGLLNLDHTAPSDSAHLTLRARRSEDSLTVRRRMQRQQDVGAVDMPMQDGFPVPRLPDWARTENRCLRPSGPQAASSRMARTVSHDVRPAHARHPAEPLGHPGQAAAAAHHMQRANSHDATSLHLSFGPSLMSNFERWHGADQAHRPLSPISSARSHSAMDQRTIVPQSPCDVVTPPNRLAQLPPLSHGLNRGSVSSAASDSDVSGISSVPQTPISRMNALPCAQTPLSLYRDSQHVNSVYYDIDPIIEDESAWHEQENVAKSTSPSKGHHAPPSAYFMMPTYPSSARPTHTPSTSISSVASSQENHANARGLGRPRANTNSSVIHRPAIAQQPTSASSISSSSSTISRNHSTSSARESPRRNGSMKNFVLRPGSSAGEKRTSTASNESTGTSSSGSSNSSGASALLSYMRGFSKSQSNLSGSFSHQSHSKASSSATLHATATATSSPTKSHAQRTFTAEQVANSIGRRFGRSIATGSRANHS